MDAARLVRFRVFDLSFSFLAVLSVCPHPVCPPPVRSASSVYRRMPSRELRIDTPGGLSFAIGWCSALRPCVCDPDGSVFRPHIRNAMRANAVRCAMRGWRSESWKQAPPPTLPARFNVRKSTPAAFVRAPLAHGHQQGTSSSRQHRTPHRTRIHLAAPTAMCNPHRCVLAILAPGEARRKWMSALHVIPSKVGATHRFR